MHLDRVLAASTSSSTKSVVGGEAYHIHVCTVKLAIRARLASCVLEMEGKI